jgi:hypothetical protein
MATKPIFRVVDVPCDATAGEMETALNGVTDDGYTLHSISYSWPNVGARAVFRLPARLVHGKWVRGED